MRNLFIRNSFLCTKCLSNCLPLVAIPLHEKYPRYHDQSHINSVDNEMRNEAVDVARGVAVLEDLGCSHVGRSPADEGHADGCALLCLTRDVTRHERDYHVALCEEELSAVECDEEPTRVQRRGLDGDNNHGTDDWRYAPELSRSAIYRRRRVERHSHWLDKNLQAW